MRALSKGSRGRETDYLPETLRKKAPPRRIKMSTVCKIHGSGKQGQAAAISCRQVWLWGVGGPPGSSTGLGPGLSPRKWGQAKEGTITGFSSLAGKTSPWIKHLICTVGSNEPRLLEEKLKQTEQGRELSGRNHQSECSKRAWIND